MSSVLVYQHSHLRLQHCQATLALAETLSLNIDMRFTDPASPVFLEIDGDLAESLFVISTTNTASIANNGTNSGAQTRAQQSRAASLQPKGKKRALEQDDEREREEDQWGIRDGDDRAASVSSSARRKPMKAVVPAERASVARELQGGPSNRSTPLRQTMPPPSFIPRTSFPPPASLPRADSPPPPAPTPSRKAEPLFLPGSQLSQAAEAAIRESGLGIEKMDADEFAAMMEDEGEEFDINARQETETSVSGGWDERGGESGADADVSMQEIDELADDDDGTGDDQQMNARESDSFDLYEDNETQFGPTQGSVGSAGSKVRDRSCAQRG